MKQNVVGIIIAVLLAASWIHYKLQPVEVEGLPPSLQRGTTLVYFGTNDCGACQTYKNGGFGGGLPTTRRIARKSGFNFVQREIASLRRLGKKGAFGSYDTLYQAARASARRNAVPMFAVVSNGKLVAARTSYWEKMAKVAAEEAAATAVR